MTATPTAPSHERVTDHVFDYELEQHQDDNVVCVFGDGEAATHICQHGTCRMMLCPKHADATRKNIASAVRQGVSMWCSVCHGSGLNPNTITVRPV